jgi:hypothetical protein
MRVFNEESIFISLEKCFCTFSCEFVEVSSSISISRDRIRALLSLPRLALRTEKFQESSLCTLCAVNVGLFNGMAMYVTCISLNSVNG